jgi:hypothetical protein
MKLLIFYVLLFRVVYLTWCNFVRNLTKKEHQMLCKSQKKCWKWLDKRLGKKVWDPNGNVKTHRTVKGNKSKEEIQEHAHHFLWYWRGFSQRIRPRRPNSQFCIMLWSFRVTTWECAKTMPQNLATKELGIVSRQRTISHFLFHPEIFYRNQHDCRPPLILLLFPWLKIKLERRHFDTTEVMKAESHVLLNISLNTTSRKCLKIRSAAYVRIGTTSRAIKPK